MFKRVIYVLILCLMVSPVLAQEVKQPTDADKAKAVAAEAVKVKKEQQAKSFEKALADLKAKHNCEQVIAPPDIAGFIIRGQNGAEQLLKLQIVTVPKD